MTLPFAPDELFVRDFGTLALVGPLGAQTRLQGIYDAPTANHSGRPMAPVAERGHQLRCRDVDLPAVALGMRVEVVSKTFNIQAIEPDGTGMTLLKLKQTSLDPRTRPY
jgi:hypothetical protein